MLRDKSVAAADMASPPPDPTSLEIKVQPDDAIFGPTSVRDSDKASKGGFFRAVARLALVAVLCGLAFAGGAYYSSGHSLFGFMKLNRASDVQQSTEREQMMSALRQMDDEIRALKSSIDGQDTARAADAEKMKTTAGATITDLVARVDKLQSELTAKLSQVNEQLAAIEQKLSTSHSASASRGPSHNKHAENAHDEHAHDAFNPALDPNAPGAPRPLGSH